MILRYICVHTHIYEWLYSQFFLEVVYELIVNFGVLTAYVSLIILCDCHANTLLRFSFTHATGRRVVDGPQLLDFVRSSNFPWLLLWLSMAGAPEPVHCCSTFDIHTDNVRSGVPHHSSQLSQSCPAVWGTSYLTFLQVSGLHWHLSANVRSELWANDFIRWAPGTSPLLSTDIAPSKMIACLILCVSRGPKSTSLVPGCRWSEMQMVKWS